MPTTKDHFSKSAPSVAAVYQAILSAARTFGPCVEDPKKTSIHLVRRTAFAGVATRKDALILTLKSATDIASPRIIKREQVSKHRWHLEIRLDDPKQVDRQLQSWLEESIDLSV